jgi:hypothetical protein
MGEYYVFRIQGTEYEGMRMPSGLYTAIVSTADMFSRGAFPHLQINNNHRDKFINEEYIESYKKELNEAGGIILNNPLIQYFEEKDGSRIELLENIFTPTRTAIALATAIELCDICIARNKGLKINVENSNPNHDNLSLEKIMNEREHSWMYPVDAKSVMDYIVRE